MLKRLSATFILSCIALPSFAYTIGQQLTVTNNTDKDLQIDISKIHRQAAVSQFIPAHNTVTLYTENGDNSGFLNELAIAPFTITDATALTPSYVTGNINFFVGVLHRYSYLNSVSAGEGINLDIKYSCEGGKLGRVFQNTIILNGTPSAEAPKLNISNKSCVGLKQSELNEGFNRYSAFCFDESKSHYYRTGCVLTGVNKNGQATEAVCNWAGKDKVDVTLKGKAAAEVTSTVPNNKISPETINELKTLMDVKIGNPSCAGF